MLRIVLLIILAVLIVRILLLSRMERESGIKTWKHGPDYKAFSSKGIPKSLGEYIDFKEETKKK